MENENIGKRLKTLRNLFGFSQYDVAKVLGIDRSAYCCYEIGRAKPDIHNLARLARLFHVSTDYLIFWEPAQEIPSAPSEPRPGGEKPATLLDESFMTLSNAERALIVQFRLLPDRDDILKTVQDRCAEYLRNTQQLFPAADEKQSK